MFVFFRKCNMSVFGLIFSNISQMEAERLADDVRQHCHIQFENKSQINRNVLLKMVVKL